MYRKIVKLSSLTLTLMIVLSSISLYRTVYAQARQRLYIDPAENNYFTNATSVGATFTVAIKSADWVAPGVFSYQLKFRFDPTMLNATAAEIPADHWFKPVAAGKIFIVDSGTIDPSGFVSFAASLLSPEAAKLGGGTIATVTLQIIAPPPAGGSLTSSLTLTDVILVTKVDSTATPVPPESFDLVPATFFYGSPPLAKPWVGVSSQAWDKGGADAADGLFSINVSINDLLSEWHAVGFQFRLSFNSTLLNTKEEWITPGDFAVQFGLNAGGTWNIAIVEKDVLYGQLILPPWPDVSQLDKWAHGSGTLATIKFNATYRPPPEASCDLVLSDVEVVNNEGGLVAYDHLQNGKYTITVAPPPWLSVTPRSDTKGVNEVLSLAVVMNNIVKGFRMVGTEFKVAYNTSMLQTSPTAITEGDFMKGFAQRAGTDTFFQAYVESDHGLVGIIILPLPNGTWPLDVFPEGNGTLAIFNFTVKAEGKTTIQVYDPLLVNADAKEIPVDLAKTQEQGRCELTTAPSIPPHPEKAISGRSIDLYSQYKSPYGGQGYNRTSDPLMPQAKLLLAANVTFFDDAVKGKPVTFIIQGPSGEIRYTETAITGEDGIAIATYVLPWDNPGKLWEVTATVDIGGKPVSDYLRFLVDWFITVEANLLDSKGTKEGLQLYFKGGDLKENLMLYTKTLQNPVQSLRQLFPDSPQMWLYVTLKDNLSQPVASMSFDVTDLAADVSYNEPFLLSADDRLLLAESGTMTISAYAFSGTATVHTNVLTDEPGVPYMMERVDYVYIKKG